MSNSADYAFLPVRTTDNISSQKLWKWKKNQLSTSKNDIKAGKSGFWFKKDNQDTYSTTTKWGHKLILDRNAITLKISKNGKTATIFNQLQGNKPNFIFIYSNDNGKNCNWFGDGVKFLSPTRLKCDKACLRFNRGDSNCDFGFDKEYDANQFYRNFLLNSEESWDNLLGKHKDKYYYCNNNHECMPSDDPREYKDMESCKKECSTKKWWKCKDIHLPCIPAYENESGAVSSETQCNSNCRVVLPDKKFQCIDGKCKLRFEGVSKQDCLKTCKEEEDEEETSTDTKTKSKDTTIISFKSVMAMAGITFMMFIFLIASSYLQNSKITLVLFMLFLASLGIFIYMTYRWMTAPPEPTVTGKVKKGLGSMVLGLVFPPAIFFH